MQSVDDYLAEVSRLVRDNFTSSDPAGGMPVAVVGHLVRRIIGRDHTQFGFLKFKDVIQQLEQRGVVRTGESSKGALSIWLLAQPGQPSPSTMSRPFSHGFRRLRKAVWLAFVAAMPAGRRFLNRTTGEVKLAAGSTLEKDPDWVEIVPLDADSDRKVARDFLKENGVDNADILASMNSTQWYIEFPTVLAAHSPVLASGWKRYRSHRVVTLVKEWCQKNEVDERFVLDESAPRQFLPPAQPIITGQNQLKTLLLAALERMSTDELLKLNLPAYHLVAVLRPELLG